MGHDLHSHAKSLSDIKRASGELHDIGWAVQSLKEGKKVARAGWNGKNMFLYLSPGFNPGGEFRVHSADFKTTAFLPYVAMKTVDGTCVPWLCSQTDLLAEDWEVVSG